MCSISGFTWEDKALIIKMNRTLEYRGPNDTGIYINKNISLGHNRLSIIDLSKAGHQPMSNQDGSLWIVFNGEIYNFKEIKEDLIERGYEFNSLTDTEVILYSYEEYGTECFSVFNGMFAIAIWDDEKKELILARDRLGIKPLYYYFNGSELIFSSEIKAILKHEIKKEIDVKSVHSYLKYRFIPSHKTVLKGIKKILPGYYAIFKNRKLIFKKYWILSWNNYNKDYTSCFKRLNELLVDSVKMRLNSDVPLGAYLSGGVDSSLIVAINSKLKEDKVNTFTIGYGHESDEFKYAKAVSEYLNTEHHEIVLNFDQISKDLAYIIWQMDEPNTDITMVPLYYLSKYSKQFVTVVNTGEGADEIFSGYRPYTIGSEILKPIPNYIKKMFYNWYYSPFKPKELQDLLKNRIPEPNILKSYLMHKKSKYFPDKFLNRMLFFDINYELPNWQLMRVDRMTMTHSMEARVPFLDHRIVEFCTFLPIKYKQNLFNSKFILKKIALNYLPKTIVNRKKQGFTTPMHLWIKTSLEDAIEHILLDGSKFFFNYDYINKLIKKHKSLKKQNPFQYTSFKLLILLFFDIWYDLYINEISLKEIKNKFT